MVQGNNMTLGLAEAQLNHPTVVHLTRFNALVLRNKWYRLFAWLFLPLPVPPPDHMVALAQLDYRASKSQRQKNKRTQNDLVNQVLFKYPAAPDGSTYGDELGPLSTKGGKS